MAEVTQAAAMAVHDNSEKDGGVHVTTRSVNTSNSSQTFPGRNIAYQPPSRYMTRHTLDIDDYFAGPRDMQKHSKLPFFMRIHGSVLPKMILPLAFVGVYASAITLICELVHRLNVDTVLLTVLGFVVAFGLSFRCSTGYERYSEGRKYWAQLTLTTRNLSRLIWIHVMERHEESEELGRADLLGKLTAMQLLNAFAVALKHHLRFEPAANYPDLVELISHLEGTMAMNADQDKLHHKPPSKIKAIGENLGVSFAVSNPRKLIKRSPDNLGNLPLEILTYLQSYLDIVIRQNGTMPTVCTQNLAITDVRTLTDVMGGVERVLNTPLPLAYSISISQITWVYILALPFQLHSKLGWVTIPGTLVAAYIILGLAIIGREIENPFGNDVNDLPLEEFCREIAADIDVLTSSPAPQADEFVNHKNNKMLYPLSFTGYDEWAGQSVEEIRAALKAKATTDAKCMEMARARSAAKKPERSNKPEDDHAAHPGGGEV